MFAWKCSFDELKGFRFSDPRSSAQIRGKHFCFPPRLRASAVNLGFRLRAMTAISAITAISDSP